MTTEQRILCLAVRTQIEAGAEARLLALLQGAVDWEQLWTQAHLHEVAPLLSATLRRGPYQAMVPPAWMERAQRRFYATLLQNTALSEELLRVLAAFRDVGVEALPVKGVVLAETLYGHLGLRPTADVDVLVRPQQLPTARRVLRTLGFEHNGKPTFGELHHPFHDPRYFRDSPGGEVCLELHWALWASHFVRRRLSATSAPSQRLPWLHYASRFFTLDADVLWKRAVTGQLQGIPLRILSPEDTLLYLAIHRSDSPLRLRFVCDIAELLRRQGHTLDWDYVIHQARVAGARTVLFYGLALAQELLGAPSIPGVLPRLGISRIRRRLLDDACGARALFHPAAPEEVPDQRLLTRRLLAQDRIDQIVWALGYSMIVAAWHNSFVNLPPESGLRSWDNVRTPGDRAS